jgi:carbon-monoxide dehydrogenase medium subunit
VTDALTQRVPLFGAVERSVGNPRVRAQGSIGGNCCFAEPRSDVTTLLAALGAKLILVSAARGRRELDLGEFLVGAYETARETDEILQEVVVPLGAGTRGVHIKQQHSERPIVSVVLVLDGADDACTLSVGAVGDVPLVRRVGSLAEIDPQEVAGQVDPSPDLGGSVEYKRHLTSVVVRRALEQVGERRAS